MKYEEDVERVLYEMLATVEPFGTEYKNRMKGFEKLYLFTNEQLGTCYKRLNLNGKRVLTVGSSGDQILYSLYFGASEVVCYDICPLSKYYFDLKVACIKNLTFEEFQKMIDASKMIFGEEVYAKVSHEIAGESRLFWDTLYLEGFNDYDYDINRVNCRLSSNDLYLNNKMIYNVLQKKLRAGVEVKHICGDVRDIPQRMAGEKFDAIMLSNIAQYAKGWNDLNSEEVGDFQFNELVRGLQSLVNGGGFIQVDYAYHDRLKKYVKYAEIFGHDKIKTATYGANAGAIIYYPDGKNSAIKQKDEEQVM